MASPSSSSSFEYVFIPADPSRAIESRRGDKSGGLENDELIRTAKQYFFQQEQKSATTTTASESARQIQAHAQSQLQAIMNASSPAERQQHIRRIRRQLPDGQAGLADGQILASLLSAADPPSPTCDIVALTIPTRGNRYRAVSLYCSGSNRPSPPNPRATALLRACGHGARRIAGDAFVGRARDREEAEWTRLDLRPEEINPETAEWIRIARQPGGGGGGGGGPSSGASSLSGIMEQMMKQNPNQAQSSEVAAAKEGEGATKDDGGGGIKFSWSQTDDEVELVWIIPQDESAGKQKVDIKFGSDSLKVVMAGNTIVDGKTGGRVLRDDCTYTLQDVKGEQRELCVVLGKQQVGIVWPYGVK